MGPSILPGLKMLSGSSARLMAIMASTASPCSSRMNFILPSPMPCSPVQVPCAPSARRTSRSFNASTRASAAGSAGAHLLVRPYGVMARLPDARAILRPCRPAERGATLLAGDLLHGLGLLLDARRRAVKLHQQRIAGRKVELGIAVDRLDLHVVEQLHAGDRNAR